MNGPTNGPAEFDVAVVGAGVVGCAVARMLSLQNLQVVLLEAGTDVGAATSKANTAILHTGFDATPGTLESRLVARGYDLLLAHAPSLGISIERTGAVLVAWDDEQASILPELAAKASANGYRRAELVDAAAVYDLEPHLGRGVLGGMVVPDEHLVDPWTTPLAFAREAVANGCVVLLQRRVVACRIGADITELELAGPSVAGARVRTRFVVNAAGLHGDELHRAFGFTGFTIRPRRGELIVFDKLARPLLRGTVLPVPTAHTKGVLVAPTVFGNVVLGPTADDIDDRGATATTRGGIDALLARGRRIVPALVDEEVTAMYAGLRAATEHADYQISADETARYVGLNGIRSTGLTASMALAEEALDRLVAMGLDATPAARPVTVTSPLLGELDQRPYQRGDAPGSRIVCHCERVTEGEIVGACTGVLAATDVDGLRRRTRALAGRCQGFACFAEVTELTGWDPAR